MRRRRHNQLRWARVIDASPSANPRSINSEIIELQIRKRKYVNLKIIYQNWESVNLETNWKFDISVVITKLRLILCEPSRAWIYSVTPSSVPSTRRLHLLLNKQTSCSKLAEIIDEICQRRIKKVDSIFVNSKNIRFKLFPFFKEPLALFWRFFISSGL